MKGRLPDRTQRDPFRPLLRDMINPKREPALPADRTDRDYFEKEFGPLYAAAGRPGVPVRLTAGRLILKRPKNPGDGTSAKARAEDPYMRYFRGTRRFGHRFPFDPGGFVRFRKRTGESGFGKIFEYGVRLHEEEKEPPRGGAERRLPDTTVRENDTTFPADAKLCGKVTDGRDRTASKTGIKPRRGYTREGEQPLRDSYDGKHPRRAKKAKKARKRLKTVANARIRDLRRKMNAVRARACNDRSAPYRRTVNQQRHDGGKIYSPRKPFTRRISEGRARKQYGFGNKAGIIATGNKGRGTIAAVKAFVENPYGGRTIEPLSEQTERNGPPPPKEVVCDRGGKGRKEIRGVKILIPDTPKKTDTNYMKREKRKRFRSRAGIEAVTGHLKSDFRTAQNRPHGKCGIQISALMSCAARNLKKLTAVLGGRAARLFARFLFCPFFRDFSGLLAA